MVDDKTFKELVEKVNRQEDTVFQLVKIIAKTNNLMTELQLKQKEIEKNFYS